MVLYPDGYGTAMVTLEQMKAKHGPKMHPEFARRFFAYMEYKGGTLGVGGGWRAISSVSAASAAGKSFHQDQAFASGLVRYAAVDLVTTDGPDADNLQDGVTWDMTADAPLYGLHTFIKVPNEPWHIQCHEMRGWQTWVDAGRPDPLPFILPGDVPVVPDNPFIPVEDDMSYLFKLASGDYGVRGPSGSRRVNDSEFGRAGFPTREQAIPIDPASNEAYWIGRELAAYDRSLA